MKSLEHQILLIGACGRDNFGDLLFIKIFEKLLYPEKVVVGGMVSRDLTTIGGSCVVSVRDLLGEKLFNPKNIIYCGGEILTSTKETGISMNLPCNITKTYEQVYSVCENDVANNFLGYKFSKNPLAYVLGLSDIKAKSTPVIGYFSVGGTSLDKCKENSYFLQNLRKRLKDNKIIFVRDLKTKKLLSKLINVKSYLSPDLVNIVSTTHQEEIKRVYQNDHLLKTLANKYFLFQCSDQIMKQLDRERLAQILSDIATKYNLTIILQPAGLACGHDSFEELEQLKKIISQINKKNKIYLQKNRDLWTQVAYIANARCNIGSSLHVRVVSTSFARPCVSLVNGKVNAYLETWKKLDTLPFNISTENLEEAVNTAMDTDLVTLKKNMDKLKEVTMKSLVYFFQNMNLNLNKNYRKSYIENLFPFHYRTLSKELDRLRNRLATETIKRIMLEREIDVIKKTKYWKIHIIFSSVKQKIFTTMEKFKK